MSQTQPTTSEVSELIVASLESSLQQTVPLLPKAFLRVLAKVLGGVYVLVYKYAGFIFLQMFVRHASMDETVINGKMVKPLVEWGHLVGVGDPQPATRAELVVRVTAMNQSGVLAAGSQLLYPPTGVLYLTLNAIELSMATVDVTMRASSDQADGGGEGTIGNLSPGQIVEFANPLPNVAKDAVVVAQAITAADAETPEAYRQRILDRFQNKPQGGAYADYRIWAEDEPGVEAVYPYRSNTPGEVDVYILATTASSGNEDGIPTEAQLDSVRNYIEADESGLASRRPVNAAVNVLPITRHLFNVTVKGLIADDQFAAMNAIEEAVDEYLRSREPFIVGLSVLPRRDRITLASIAGVVDDAVSALGGSVASVVLEDSGPISAYTLGHGELAKLGVVTFN